MRLAKLLMTNWLRFRGTQILTFESIVHGVVARWDGDPERSNWGGKTSTLSAVRFAMYGVHPADSEDEWISWGAAAGGVSVVFDSGEILDRSRLRGKATRFKLTLPDGRELHDAEAQAEVERRVGLSDADFVATCFFEQKKFSRFVTASSGDRLKIVRAWLGLDPLYRARDRIAADLKKAASAEAAASANVSAEVERERAILVDVDLDVPREGLADRARDAAERANRARSETAKLERARAEASGRVQDASDLARWESIGRELEGAPTERREGAAAVLVTLRRKYDDAAARANEARRVAGAATRVAAGEFDGACPVLAGFDCPAEGEINGAREESRNAAAAARGKLDGAEADRKRAEHALNVETAKEREEARARGRLDALAVERERLAPAAERARRWAGVVAVTADDFVALEVELSETRARARSAERETLAIEAAIANLAASDRRKDAAAKALEEATAKATANREALAVLLVARRTIATEALTAIAERANGLLVDAGIDLRLDVSWEREVKGSLAAACDACGVPFPASQRVKECAGCGAERGPKFSEELELKVSARSGAADDLAGMTFCLAAGAWLRDRRGSGWSCCFLDEPFGALDAAHRRLLASHLAAMLASRHGFSQAFIVAHEAGIMDGLPGRVVVSAGPESSSATVER